MLIYTFFNLIPFLSPQLLSVCDKKSKNKTPEQQFLTNSPKDFS